MPVKSGFLAPKHPSPIAADSGAVNPRTNRGVPGYGCAAAFTRAMFSNEMSSSREERHER